MQYHDTGFKTIIKETCFSGNLWGWGCGGCDTSVGYKGLMCWENGRSIISTRFYEA